MAQKLEFLSLAFNQIENLDGLEFLGELKTLNLGHNQLSELRNMRNVPNIEELFLEYNDFEVIRQDALANNKNILTLHIDNNVDLESLSFLSYLPNLVVSISNPKTINKTLKMKGIETNEDLL